MPIRVCTIYAEVGPPERKYGKQGKKGKWVVKNILQKRGCFLNVRLINTKVGILFGVANIFILLFL